MGVLYSILLSIASFLFSGVVFLVCVKIGIHPAFSLGFMLGVIIVGLACRRWLLEPKNLRSENDPL